MADKNNKYFITFTENTNTRAKRKMSHSLRVGQGFTCNLKDYN